MASLLGVSQPNISRYESAAAGPSSAVFMHCLHICGLCSDLTSRMTSSDPQWSQVLTALGQLESAIHSATYAREEVRPNKANKK